MKKFIADAAMPFFAGGVAGVGDREQLS